MSASTVDGSGAAEGTLPAGGHPYGRRQAGSGARPLAATARLPRWWPLAAITLLAAALRLSTLDLQSFWYDEAFTPVHVLHPSLWATLRSVVHTENSPPLWYVIAWLDARVLGTGEVALRLPSALAGIATVPVAWEIGRELAGRRAAIGCALLVAVNPLFVWYSQEARVYSLFVFTSALALLCFLRAEREPTGRRMAAFAGAGALALLTHYFAVFMLIPMALWLLCQRPLRRAALPAIAALTVVGLALLPLIFAQGGHGTQWIGRWPLSERLLAIPQYYLLGPSGEPLGHGIELLVALPLLAAAGLGLWRLSGQPTAAPEPAVAPAPSRGRDGAHAEGHGQVHDRLEEGSARTPERAASIVAFVAGGGVLLPLLLAIFGADYLAPRNLVGAMIPLTALIVVLALAPQTGRAGAVLLALGAFGFAVITIDVDLSPRLQRGNWREVARVLRTPALASQGRASPRALRSRAITTVELGSAPLEYYLPGLHNLPAGSSVLVSEIDETGYAPLRASAGEPPAQGFRLLARLDVDGLIVYRFVSPLPRRVREATLRRHVITLAHPEVLVPAASVVLP
ncbi:MAG TPA: glycosyltransferase family 39 protein [Solirubrobacteraceae bacterium]|nr:glycosyltransferase family 39 protein [Solirubrobacteraceae bacterium]